MNNPIWNQIPPTSIAALNTGTDLIRQHFEVLLIEIADRLNECILEEMSVDLSRFLPRISSSLAHGPRRPCLGQQLAVPPQQYAPRGER
jgi:hypothetical protein